MRNAHPGLVGNLRRVLGLGRNRAVGDQLAQLLLPDDVVAVWNQVFAHFGEGVGDASVGFGRRSQRGDLHVQVVVEVSVLRVQGCSQFLFL